MKKKLRLSGEVFQVGRGENLFKFLEEYSPLFFSFFGSFQTALLVMVVDVVVVVDFMMMVVLVVMVGDEGAARLKLGIDGGDGTCTLST